MPRRQGVTQIQIEIKETIYFDLDKATIKPISFPLLDGVAAALTAHKTLNISIEGHTDDLANDDYNMKLSQRRAEAVRSSDHEGRARSEPSRRVRDHEPERRAGGPEAPGAVSL